MYYTPHPCSGSDAGVSGNSIAVSVGFDFGDVMMNNVTWGEFDLTEHFKVIGHNPSIDAATPEDVWCVGGDFVWPTTADHLSIVSTSANDAAAGSGARTLGIEGTDAGGFAQSEFVTLNGLTPVITTKEFYRVNRARVYEVGSGGVNAGDISIAGEVTADVYCGVATGRGISSQAIYTVPADYAGAYLVRVLLSSAAKHATTAKFDLKIRPYGLSWLTVRTIAVSSTPYEARIQPHASLKLSPRTDLILRADVASNATAVSAGFDFILRR